MTLADAHDGRRETSGRRKLWMAMALAIAAVAIAALVVLGGRSRPSAERRGGEGLGRASTSAADAAGAVDATPAADAMAPGAFGGPGSAADGTTGPLGTVATPGAPGTQQVAAGQTRPRARRAPRRQAENRARPAEPPSYRAIGPTASDEPPPPQT